jgi:hypothetical protein
MSSWMWQCTVGWVVVMFWRQNGNYPLNNCHLCSFRFKGIPGKSTNMLPKLVTTWQTVAINRHIWKIKFWPHYCILLCEIQTTDSMQRSNKRLQKLCFFVSTGKILFIQIKLFQTIHKFHFILWITCTTTTTTNATYRNKNRKKTKKQDPPQVQSSQKMLLLVSTLHDLACRRTLLHSDYSEYPHHHHHHHHRHSWLISSAIKLQKNRSFCNMCLWRSNNKRWSAPHNRPWRPRGGVQVRFYSIP